jgi:hypothetical protein
VFYLLVLLVYVEPVLHGVGVVVLLGLVVVLAWVLPLLVLLLLDTLVVLHYSFG